MTHQLNGRGFSENADVGFKTPFVSRFDKRDQAATSVMARRYARRARRDNRAY